MQAAIEFMLKNFDAAREALTDMPPREEQELDPVSVFCVRVCECLLFFVFEYLGPKPYMGIPYTVYTPYETIYAVFPYLPYMREMDLLGTHS
jgi:hypothetical protein